MTDQPIPRATHDGILRIGDIAIPCAVLEDGTRLLTQQGIFVALGRHKKPSQRQLAVDNRPAFVAAKNLEPFITPEFRRVWAVVKFRPVKGGGFGGKVAYGYNAEILPHLCGLFLDAQDARDLLPSQEHIARRCKILLRGFAHVGIVALVDEATGYQAVRARNELHKILQAYIAPELLPWTKRFPDDFYKEMFRLMNWPYNAMSPARPGYVGKLTNTLIYEELPPGVLDELRRKNPRNERGRRKHCHHQLLTADIGNPHLDKQLAVVLSFMRASANKREFFRLFRRAFPEKPKPESLGPEGLIAGEPA